MAKLTDISVVGFERNPLFDDSVKIVRFQSDQKDIRACLKINKADKSIQPKHNKHKDLINIEQSVKEGKILKGHYKRHSIPDGCRAITKEPKWVVHFRGIPVDEETGEIDYSNPECWSCNDDELALSRKRKAIKKFTEVYSPLYEERKVSVMFLTLTRCNVAPVTIKQFIDIMQKRFLRHKIPVLGYFWVNEISEGFHHHYHIAIATKRVYFKKLPKWIKFDDVWGQGTSIEFIRKSVKAYMGKYIGKNNVARLRNFRTYGKSRKYNIPT